MDRFIAEGSITTDFSIDSLKSNMDRFIDEVCFSDFPRFCYLKSNMDRFIVFLLCFLF